MDAGTETSAPIKVGSCTSLPNFFVVGTARAGTTALHDYLVQHPDVFMCEPKEPHYFAFAGRRPTFTGPGDELFVNRVAVTDQAGYQRLFTGAKSCHAIGDGSVSYLYFPKAAQRIADQIPGAKIICILRDPVDRAFSSYMYLRFRLREPLSSFTEALDAEPRRIEQGWHHLWHYTRMGLYSDQIERYLALFPQDQIKVILFEDLLTRRDEVLSELFAFLGVDDSFVPHLTPVSLASGLPKHRFFQRLMMAPTPVHTLLRKYASKRVLRRIANLNAATVEINPETARRLARFYEQDLAQLSQLLDRDFTFWTRKWLDDCLA